MRFAPIYVTTLIDIHTLADPDVREFAADNLEADGLIVLDSAEGEPKKWITTGRGEKWLEMILETPLPQWADPRQLPKE